MWSALASAAASGVTGLLGSWLEYKGQKDINKKNIDAQDKANQLSIELANTSHQREVNDLRKAGLNPILSAGGSGAPTPSISAVRAENPYRGVGASAGDVGKQIARYTSSQYRLENAALELDNAQRDIEVRRSSAQAAADIAQSNLDAEINQLRSDALSDYLSPSIVSAERDENGKIVRDDHGRTIQRVRPNFELINKREEELKGYLLDGIKSGMQTQFWNNWLSPLTGGASAVNSGASALGTIRNMFRPFRR